MHIQIHKSRPPLLRIHPQPRLKPSHLPPPTVQRGSGHRLGAPPGVRKERERRRHALPERRPHCLAQAAGALHSDHHDQRGEWVACLPWGRALRSVCLRVFLSAVTCLRGGLCVCLFVCVHAYVCCLRGGMWKMI